MTKVREYFREKYDKSGPAYMQGVLRTIDKLPPEDEEPIPSRDEATWEQREQVEVVEK